jgi:hypothetical protein
MFSFDMSYNMQWVDEGRNTAARRDVWPDSLFVANGHYWLEYDVDPATGREIPVSLQTKAARDKKTDPDFYIKLYGGNANKAIRDQQASLDTRTAWSWIPWLSHHAAGGVQYHVGEEMNTADYDSEDRDYWARINDKSKNPNYPGTGEGNLLVGHSQETAQRVPLNDDRRAYGSIMFLFATPKDFGPAAGRVLGNVRANLVYRFFTGTRFTYADLVRGVESFRYGPMHDRMDMNLEKQFPLGSRGSKSLTLAMEVSNLFNQKDNRQVSAGGGRAVDMDPVRWENWGIAGREPTNAEFLKYGEIYDTNNYWDQPRQMNFSVRVKW